jgi:hypothetical protein
MAQEGRSGRQMSGAKFDPLQRKSSTSPQTAKQEYKPTVYVPILPSRAEILTPLNASILLISYRYLQTRSNTPGIYYGFWLPTRKIRRTNPGMKTLKNRALTISPTPQQRSATTNGKRTFVVGNGRGAWARRWRDLQSLYTNDIGDENSLSEFQFGLISTAATLRCELERMEGELSLGKSIDTDTYGRIAGHYRRIVATLGIQRRNMREINPPSVESYLAHVAKQKQSERDDEADIVEAAE